MFRNSVLNIAQNPSDVIDVSWMFVIPVHETAILNYSALA
jgi:hypothetical protein